MKIRISRKALIQAIRGFVRGERVAQTPPEKPEEISAYVTHLLNGMRLNNDLKTRVFNTVAFIEKSGTQKQKDRLSDLKLETNIFLTTIFQAVGLARCDPDEQKRVLTRKLLEGYPRMAQSIAVAEARSFCLNRVPQ